MDLQAFFMENAAPFREEEFPLSERFSRNGEPAVFRLRGISKEENAANSAKRTGRNTWQS